MVLAETHTDVTEHPTDLDSHADTCVVGKNAFIVHLLDKKVNVTGFDPSLGKVTGLNLVSAALAYDCPETGDTVILMIHQAVHVPTMINDLLCPMQMRVNNVSIQECPKFLEEHPNDTSHALRINQDGEEFVIPFALRGVVSHFPTRKPTTAEYQSCRRIELTSEEPEWDPSSAVFQDQEDATVDAHGRVYDTWDRKNRRIISSS
jgi:hypothetical protein